MSREVLYHKACGTQIGWWLGPHPLPERMLLKSPYVEFMDGTHPKTGDFIRWTCPKCGYFGEWPGIRKDDGQDRRVP